MTPTSGWEEELRHRLHGIFMGESAQRLEALEAAVEAVESGTAGTDVDHHLAEAQRHAHTLTGGARAVGLVDVERLSHALETTFESLRGGAPAGPETWSAVTAAVEAVRARLAGASADVDAVVAALPAPPTGAG